MNSVSVSYKGDFKTKPMTWALLSKKFMEAFDLTVITDGPN